MSEHPSRDEIRRFAESSISGHRVIEIARHLKACRRCATEARTSEPAVRAGLALFGELVEDEEHPPVESVLTRYVDGTLDADELAPIEDHLFRCPRCREDVDDLRAMAAVALQPRRRRRRVWPAFAAAAAVAVVASVIFSSRAEPERDTPRAIAVPPRVIANAPAPQRYARDGLNEAVSAALRNGAMPMPAALADLQLDDDPERAPGTASASRIEPSGEIVESARPRFRWPSSPRTKWIVSLFDERGSVVAESGVLNQPSWQPDRELPRGRVYQVQVRAIGEAGETIIPAPPAPPAFFRVLDEAAHAELAAARAAHSADPLLLGVLYARHGLQADAIRELERVPGPEAQRLLASIRAWDSR
jgi:Putative zinc-finger